MQTGGEKWNQKTNGRWVDRWLKIQCVFNTQLD